MTPQPRLRLEGKVCIVSGAGSRGAGIGTGRAAALLFAREGGRVLVVDQDEDAATATAEMIGAEGGASAVFVGDMTHEDDARRMVDAALERWGRVDVLDNNIGVQQFGTVVTASVDDWDRAFALNVKATVLASKYAIPAMAASGGGSIVNISSIAGFRPRGGNAPYAMTKGAVVPLTRTMAIDHGPDGIRVNAVIPGPIFTPMAEAEGVEERRQQRVSASAIKRVGDGWDVANAALFFASDESRYVTGAVLPVEGGVMVRTPDR
ncbi:MAG: short-chain dehydrogenase [Pseudonocardia sp. SCN 72-86]|nr:MAG: short-chain dehydrogenase [Pseudonocardia sp. SCN 72-86]